MQGRRTGGGPPRRRQGGAEGGGEGGGPLRLQVYLARAGVASRRASEEMIREGRVEVNGHRVTELGTKVDPSTDRVAVDGAPVRLEKKVWVVLHKPAGYVTTRDDPGGRRTVYDLLPDELRHLFHVGRLDRASMGVLLLTNDGEAANQLLHPRYGTTREYLADVEGDPTDEVLERLAAGVRLEDGIAQAQEVEVVGAVDEESTRVRVVLQEGRNREVRRMFEAVGHPVLRLVRRRFGPVGLRGLARGRWRYLTADELRQLPGGSPREPGRRGRAKER